MTDLVRRLANGSWDWVLVEPGDGAAMLAQPFSLTAEQIKASTLTPVTVIPAPGADKLLVPLAFAYGYTFVTTPYSGAAVDLVYGDQDLNQLFIPLDLGESQAGWSLGAGMVEGDARALYVNQPIKLRALLRGAIASSTVADGGAGYAVNDTGTVDDGDPDATYRIDTVALGAVTAFTLTSAGGGYNLAPGGAETDWTTTPGGGQPGVGSGFRAKVTAIDASDSAGDGMLAGTIFYVVADV